MREFNFDKEKFNAACQRYPEEVIKISRQINRSLTKNYLDQSKGIIKLLNQKIK